MSAFYVYEHWRPDRDECFYVGKGKGDRARSMNQRNRAHRGVQRKLEALMMRIEVKIVSTHEIEAEALAAEIALIAQYGRKIDGGSLCNMTLGGEGTAGHRHSPEVIEIIRKKLTGQKRTPEQVERIRRSQIGKVASPELCRKRSENAKGHPYYPKTPEGLERCGAANRGKILSPERRAEISDHLRKREVKAETRKIISDRMQGNQLFLGRRHTPETIEKMKASNKAAWIKRRASQA